MRSRSFAEASTRRFLTLGLIPLVVVGILAGGAVASVQRDAVGFSSSLAAESTVARVEAFLSEASVALTQVGHLSGDPHSEDLLVRALAEHVGSVESVVLVDRNGVARAVGLSSDLRATTPDFEGLDRSRDPVLIEARATGRPAWSGVFTSSVSGDRVLAIAVPDESGAVMATVEIETLASVLREVELDTDASVVVADRRGNVLFHSDEPTARLRPNWLNLEPIRQGAQGRSGRFEYEVDGVPMYGSTAVAEGAGWIVLVQQPRSSALRPVMNVWVGTAAIIAVAGLVAVVAALLFSKGLSEPIAQIADAAAAIEEGDYEVQMPQSRLRELSRLADSIASMSQAVQDREAVLMQSLELLAVEAREKSLALKRLSAMSAELSITEERERRRLAEELHDRVSQVLAVAKMRLGLIRDGTDASARNADAVDELLAEAVSQTRAITTELAPPVLYELGLGAAVADMCDRMGTQYGISVHFEAERACEGLSDDAKTAVFRAARELVMNVVKHAEVDEAWVSLSHEDDVVRLEVRDEGNGIPAGADTDTRGFGLFSIRERLIHLDGSVEIDSSPGVGTRVVVSVPCQAQHEPR